MNLVKRLLQTATVAVAFVAATAVMTSDAAAQHCGGGVVGHGIVHGGHHGGLHGGLHHGGLLHGGCHTTLYPGFAPGFYHDTSHWDYHPPQKVWHCNHWDIIPGHYDWHQTGHWHGGGIIYP